MSISTEQAEEMVAEKMAKENPKTEDQKTETTESGQQEEPKQETETKAEAEGQEPKAEVKETETEEPKEPKQEETPKAEKKKRLPPSQVYTHEERIAHRFAVEKHKRQAAQARVKELEAELAKVKGLKPEDFNNDVESYTSYRLDEQKKLDEIERQKRFIEQSEQEEIERETERKVSKCFPNANDRAEYEDLIAQRGRDFYDALQANDPKGVVLDYLNGIDEYPLVLRELMTNMKSLAHVFRDKDPYELRHNLHVFTKELLSGKTKENETETEPPKPKAAIPVIGKQVTAQAKPAEPVHDRAYWNEYLRKHPNG